MHAAKAGAKEVLGLDISEEAVALATRNAELNALANCSFRTANVFDFLTEASRTGKQWDVIVLDPPAFAKSRAAMENAYRGYKEINLRALKCIPNGGYLVTAVAPSTSRPISSARWWPKRRVIPEGSCAKCTTVPNLPITRSSGACRKHTTSNA